MVIPRQTLCLGDDNERFFSKRDEKVTTPLCAGESASVGLCHGAMSKIKMQGLFEPTFSNRASEKVGNCCACASDVERGVMFNDCNVEVKSRE